MGKVYNGNGRFNLPIIISTIAIAISLLQGFWSIADPRGNLAKLESKFDQYITIREFEESKKNSFRAREEIRKDLEAVSSEQNKRTGYIEIINYLRRDFDKLSARLDDYERTFSSSVTLKDTLRDIQEQIKNLRDKVLITPKEINK
jgi:hypothetical protein